MGGLARRVSYIKAFKTRSNAEVPTLCVDAGNLFTDDRFAAGQLPSEAGIKNRWMVKGYGDYRHDAANLSYADLPYLGELLQKDGYDQRVADLPFIKKLVSANVVPLNDSLITPPPYVIREITLKRGSPGHTIRVGIVGFTEPKPVAPNAKESVYGSFRIDDPFQAARRVLPELKSRTDFIIAPLPFIRLKPGTSPREVSDWSIVQLQLGSCLVIYSLAQAEAFDRRQVMNCNRRVPRRSNSILLEAFEQTIDRLAADADHHR